MTEVVLHLYEATGHQLEKTNFPIIEIIRVLNEALNTGNILHCSIQVYEDTEWSFGFCRDGTGVFSCSSGQNPLYTYRERLVLGRTEFSMPTVDNILNDFCREWPGQTYDLLSRNSKHFCDEFCERLGVAKPPDWVDWLANMGDPTSLRMLSLRAFLRNYYQEKVVLYKPPQMARFQKNLEQTLDEMELKVQGMVCEDARLYCIQLDKQKRKWKREGQGMVCEDARLYCIQLDKQKMKREGLWTREEWFTKAHNLYDKGDTDRALKILLEGCAIFQNDEGLWLEAYNMADMQTAKMVIERALMIMPDSKPFLALDVAFKCMDDEVEVELAVKTMVSGWIRRGRRGGEDLWLQTAMLLEEERFPNTCIVVVQTTISVEERSSWLPVPKQLEMQGYPITSWALYDLLHPR